MANHTFGNEQKLQDCKLVYKSMSSVYAYCFVEFEKTLIIRFIYE